MSTVRWPPSAYWMRAVSFAGLHRLLQAVGNAPRGLHARDINALVLEKGVTLTPRLAVPKPTTLYHYRNTLLRLGALVRDGRVLRVNIDNPHVDKLLRDELPPALGDQSLSDVAREKFATLVLSNNHCRNLFFDIFMPSNEPCDSVSVFQKQGCPVSWKRAGSASAATIVFRNCTTGRTISHAERLGAPAILYGLRYWARDELALIDEYCDCSDEGTTMFPVLRRAGPSGDPDPNVFQAARFLLSQRGRHPGDEWTLLSISDLIVNYCQAHRQPRTVLFDAIDWLFREWPRHTILVPTSLGLATLAAGSPGQEQLVLRRYYKPKRGPYISHIRFHRDVNLDTMPIRQDHA